MPTRAVRPRQHPGLLLQFPAILRRCLGACLTELKSTSSAEPDEALFNLALSLNQEASDHAVRPLTGRLIALFPKSQNDPLVLERLSSAFLRPVFATASLGPNAIRVLATRRARGQSLAIVSNTPWGSSAAIWRDELNRHGLLAAVDATVFCVEAGFRKPHPAPIRRTLEALNVTAGDSIFVGDDVRWDVLGARAAGVRPLSLVPPAAGDAPPDDVPVVHHLRDVLEHIAASD
jgi:FMN phosphatase YigB (HAD superfamily)